MTSRVKDVDGKRELQLDASARPGHIFVIGKGICFEFELEKFLNALGRELTSDRILRAAVPAIE